MKVWEVVDGLWQKIPLTGSTLRNHFRKMAEEKKLVRTYGSFLLYVSYSHFMYPIIVTFRGKI